MVEKMRVGLIDVDGHNFPNLALMKLSAYYKARGDIVEWWSGFEHYDLLYMSRIFDATYTPDPLEPCNADRIIKGGTGYGLKNVLPDAIEHIMPDYSLYGISDTAYGFLTRGCPRHCPFCIVGDKEGLTSRKVANLSEWWSGQKNIVLMDANLFAFRQHMELLNQLIESQAAIDINQGIDARLLTKENIGAINKIRLKEIHFAWDLMREEKTVLRGLDLYASMALRKPHGAYATVYVLTNYDTTIDENLYRIYALRDRGYDPYVMIYDKPNAPREVRTLQRWCNNRIIFKKCPNFKDYISGKERRNEANSGCLLRKPNVLV